MNLYLAPLEGITGHIYRNALHQCFDGFDKYFIPFISPNQKGHFSTREKKDVMPENNEGMYAVPQILTNNVEDFLCTVISFGPTLESVHTPDECMDVASVERTWEYLLVKQY